MIPYINGIRTMGTEDYNREQREQWDREAAAKNSFAHATGNFHKCVCECCKAKAKTDHQDKKVPLRSAAIMNMYDALLGRW